MVEKLQIQKYQILSAIKRTLQRNAIFSQRLNIFLEKFLKIVLSNRKNNFNKFSIKIYKKKGTIKVICNCYQKNYFKVETILISFITDQIINPDLY